MCVHMPPVWIVGLWHRGEVQHTEDVNVALNYDSDDI